MLWKLQLPGPLGQARRTVRHAAHALNASTATRTSRKGTAHAPLATADTNQKMTYLPGSYEIPVASFEHHADAVRDTIAAVAGGADPDATLHPEPSNAFDRNAIAVHMAGGKIGYLPRTLATALKPAITAAATLSGRPVGCPTRIITGSGSPQIVLRIHIAGLGIDPASLR